MNEYDLPVTEIINNCINSKNRYLNLSSKGLINFEFTIREINHLEVLDLDNNKIEKIPDSICELKMLRELRLANNKLVTLPETMGNLENLETLILDNNSIVKLPKSLGKLNNLKRLYLHNNPKLGIPSEILGPSRFDAIRESAKAIHILEWYFRDPKIVIARDLELEFRRNLRSNEPDIENARDKLIRIVDLDPDSERALVDEFRFLFKKSRSDIYNFPILSLIEIKVLLEAWKTLSLDSYNYSALFPIAKSPELNLNNNTSWGNDLSKTRIPALKVTSDYRPEAVLLSQEVPEDQNEEIKLTKYSSGAISSTQIASESQKKGELLEISVLDLLRNFFPSVDTDILRRQRSGTQFGRDLEFSFTSHTVDSKRVVCYIECKNYNKDIRLEDIAGKIFSSEFTGKKLITGYLLRLIRLLLTS